MISPRQAALEGTALPIAAVSTGFPAGLSPFALAGLREIRDERRREEPPRFDIRYFTPAIVLSGDWQALYDELRASARMR